MFIDVSFSPNRIPFGVLGVVDVGAFVGGGGFESAASSSFSGDSLQFSSTGAGAAARVPASEQLRLLSGSAAEWTPEFGVDILR